MTGTSLRLPAHPNTEGYTLHGGGKVGQRSLPKAPQRAGLHDHAPTSRGGGHARRPAGTTEKGKPGAAPARWRRDQRPAAARAARRLRVPSTPLGPTPSLAPGPQQAGRRTRESVLPATAPSQATSSVREDTVRVCTLGGGRDAPGLRDRGSSGRAWAGRTSWGHLGSIFFPPGCGAGFLLAGGASKTVRLEHRETVLAALGRHPRRNKSLSRLPAQPASL